MDEKRGLIVAIVVGVLTVVPFLVATHFFLYYVNLPPFTYLRPLAADDSEGFILMLALLTWVAPFFVVWWFIGVVFKHTSRCRFLQVSAVVFTGLAAVYIGYGKCQPGPDGCRPDRGEIVEYGTYVGADTGEYKVLDFATIISGSEPKSLWLDEQTNRIPNTPGTTFGVKFIVTAFLELGDAEITVRVLHPPIRNKTITQWTQTAKLGEESFGASRLSEVYQSVPGAWTFQVMYEEEVLAEKSFEVVEAP